MKSKLLFSKTVLSVFFVLLLLNCKKDNPKTLPVVTTSSSSSVTNITGSSVTVSGEISSDGGDQIIARGFCWSSTNTTPSTADTKSSDGTGSGKYTSTLTGLLPGTTYNIRTYATNSVGIVYGNIFTFKTAAILPTVTTITASSVTNITSNSTKVSGEVTADGGDPVTARGFCWSSTNATPTIADSKSTDGTGKGTFTSSLTGLLPGTTYNIRSYSTNSVGTVYGNVISFNTLAPSIYIAGFETNNGIYVAKYWKNGIAVNLSDGTKDAYAASIFVSGSDVYACGWEKNSNNINVAKYWKNGTSVNLTDGTNKAAGFSIFISGNDVYVSGTETNSNLIDVAKYWKNGVPTSLTTGTQNADASSIFVSGNDIYVCGYEEAGNHGDVAKYWKNGTPKNLTDGIHLAYTNIITVIGSDVYVTGMNEGMEYFFYWKNGVAVSLATDRYISSYGIAVVGDDVYVSGETDGHDFIKYWKNGSVTSLTDGSHSVMSGGIAVVGSDVYVVGSEENSNGKFVAKYWKNGVASSLTDGTKNAWAPSIFIY